MVVLLQDVMPSYHLLPTFQTLHRSTPFAPSMTDHWYDFERTSHAYTEVLRHLADGRLCQGLSALGKAKLDARLSRKAESMLFRFLTEHAFTGEWSQRFHVERALFFACECGFSPQRSIASCDHPRCKAARAANLCFDLGDRAGRPIKQLYGVLRSSTITGVLLRFHWNRVNIFFFFLFFYRLQMWAPPCIRETTWTCHAATFEGTRMNWIVHPAWFRSARFPFTCIPFSPLLSSLQCASYPGQISPTISLSSSASLSGVCCRKRNAENKHVYRVVRSAYIFANTIYCSSQSSHFHPQTQNRLS